VPVASKLSILIVGGGEFGLTAALELRRRGWRVTLLEAGTLPNPLSASDDISKVVRADYGFDEQHTAMGELALAGWRQWNRDWNETLFHEDGFLVLTREPMAPGGFEHDSFAHLTARGHALERLDEDIVRKRFPAWAVAGWRNGYFNPGGGWVESGRVIARLAESARAAGVEIHERLRVTGWIENGRSVIGARVASGAEFRADLALVAAGAWTPSLVPELREVLKPSGQTVVHFQVPDAHRWQAPGFPVWAADIARTGWYGFPAKPDGTLKIANHGPGRPLHPDDPREVLAADIERFRNFLRENLSGLADAPILKTHLCFYCDASDGAFWMDHLPQRPGLVIAAGDSGHAFKFAPVLGGLIADVVERKPNPWAARYAARSSAQSARLESARAGN
jgi:glycine/D-amino acid oxidase-like deaminating enzyme